MKLKIDKPGWRGNHAHHRDSIKKVWQMWPQISSVRTIKEDDSFDIHECVHPYSIVLWGVLNDATRRCAFVSMDVKVMEGQPCIEGTRIPVKSVLRAVELYGSIEEALKCYPNLSKEQVKDALYFSQVLLELPSGINETTVVD